MSFALGMVAERAGIIAGYTLLALLYAAAMLFAMRARQLQSAVNPLEVLKSNP
jgi:hypothetical protein